MTGASSWASYDLLPLLPPGRGAPRQFEVFEQMRYVCVGEFEHAPDDPDEERTAGGCPSALAGARITRTPAST
jgi:hypothetical protein